MAQFTYVFMAHVQKSHPFEQALCELGICHKLIPVATPEQNGKVERSHRTLAEEGLPLCPFRKGHRRDYAIKRWVNFYNHQRPHSALHWLTPYRSGQP